MIGGMVRLLDYVSVMKKKSRILSKADQRHLLGTVSSNLKYKAIVCMLLDTGLRVSELTTLKFQNIDLVQDFITVRSLKKREGSKINRDLPLSDRARTALVEYIGSLKNTGKDDYLFPTNSAAGHISRFRVHRYIRKATGKRFSPHDLRHTFATRVVDETKDIRIAQALLGHESQVTTERYCHKTIDSKRRAISKIEYSGWLGKLKLKFARKNKNVILFDLDTVDAHVGRSKEIRRLTDLYEKRINGILIGGQGVGKSHLLERLTGDNILRLDDFKSVRALLKGLVSCLVDDHGKGVLLACYLGLGSDEVVNFANGDTLSDGGEVFSDDPVVSQRLATGFYNSRVSKMSIPALVDVLKAISAKDEFTIVIDDLTDVTKTGVRALEKLKNHYHIMAASRKVKIDFVSMITNFERIDLEPFDRKTSYNLISELSSPLHARIKDYFVFRDHVYEQSSGNPLFIEELIDRLSKQKVIDIASVRETKHTAALKDIDMSLVVVLFLSSLMILRYVGSEVGDSGAFRLFGGVFLLFALFARPILTMTKRRFV